MKRNLYKSMVLVLFSVFILGGQAFGAKTLLDNFLGPYIENAKWIDRELVREVAGEVLVSKIGNAAPSYQARNNTPFQDPSSINSIQCDITVVATTLDTGTNPRSFARIDGRFYKTNTGDPTTHRGDVWAAVFIGDPGSGQLEAWYEINECTDDTGDSWEDRGHETLATALSYNTAYLVKIEYDEPNQFTFTVGAVSGVVFGPARQGAEFHEYKGLETAVYSEGGSGIGYASALFDNVFVNNNPYDDFSTGALEPTNWQALEFVREISGGKLRLNVQADDEQVDGKLRLANPVIAYLETKVTVEDGSWVAPGAKAIARIGGRYYNDSHGPGSGQDYNGFEGDVWAGNRITLDEAGTLKARCFVVRFDNPDQSAVTELFNQEFTTAIDFDTEYTLSIEFTGLKLIFKCDSESHQYDIVTPWYPPFQGQHRQLTSRVYADAAGDSGYMKATFDNVYTGCTVQPTYNASGTWDFSTFEAWDGCPSDDPEPEETGTLTITQTGDTFTVEVKIEDDRDVFSGSICGEMYVFTWSYPELSPIGWGTVTELVRITLSSGGTSGFGAYRGTWVADDGSFSCSWGSAITMTKRPDGDGGGGGGGCFIDTAGSEFRR